MPMTDMNRTSQQTKAQLKWAVACEQLSFVLDPPAGVVAQEQIDLATAVQRVQAALEDLQVAFDEKGGPMLDEKGLEAEDRAACSARPPTPFQPGELR
ncbi:hypothetical protein QTH97_30800 [Variovorax sp. J22R24]|uniref:hypothetical protein n=1 Tax=Variovorax gracilis TaxID=3053502 RepID=UPI002576C843|nr:hypothetical protein [Variovorax sp. J22R24]MDM0109353.1 hypothetical protein [Variovorax sp. J22R24]